MEELSEIFRKYIIVESEVPTAPKEEETTRERAKLATKIYRKACADLGQSDCFFKNFASWSDYVHGKMSESELCEKAKSEYRDR